MMIVRIYSTNTQVATIKYQTERRRQSEIRLVKLEWSIPAGVASIRSVGGDYFNQIIK